MSTTRINAVSATATTFAGDDFLPIDGNVNATRRILVTSLFASPSAIGSVTPAAGAFTTGTFSSTLDVTGVATLGNGAILGTPASGTVTNLTGTASININGTVGATTPSTVAATTVAATASDTPAAFTKNSDGIIQTLTRASVSEWRFNIANSDPFGGQAGSLAIYPGNASVDFIIGRSNGTTANLKITDANGNAAFAGHGTFTGGINSTAIGATTPSTGAFTTLGATGQVNITGGTLSQLQSQAGSVYFEQINTNTGAGAGVQIFQ